MDVAGFLVNIYVLVLGGFLVNIYVLVLGGFLVNIDVLVLAECDFLDLNVKPFKRSRRSESTHLACSTIPSLSQINC